MKRKVSLACGGHRGFKEQAEVWFSVKKWVGVTEEAGERALLALLKLDSFCSLADQNTVRMVEWSCYAINRSRIRLCKIFSVTIKISDFVS